MEEKSKIKYILISLICLLLTASCILVLFIFLSPQQEKLKLTFTGNFSFEIGTVNEISYTINYSDAKVEFTIEDEDIAALEDNKIFAKSVGTTKLYATATLGEMKYYTSATVEVYSNPPAQTYSFAISPVTQDCTFDGNVLSATEFSVFTLQVFDADMNLVDLSSLQIETAPHEDLKISNQFGTLTFLKIADGKIHFILPEISYDFTIIVQKVEEI